MTLLQPVWLLLLIPICVSLWVWPLPSRLLNILRSIMLLLIVLSMCRPGIRLPIRSGTLVVVADRSLSMPNGSAIRQQEAINLLQSNMSGNDNLAVVAFGSKVAVEHAPQQGKFAGFVNRVGGDASNLHPALETALALVPPNSPARILLLSDGRWTGKNPIAAATRASTRNICIDYRLLQRPLAGDIAITRVDTPGTVNPGESFMLTAWINAPVAQDIGFELWRGNTRLAAGKRQVPSGLSRLLLRDVATTAGTLGYVLKISGTNQDPIPENNIARVLVGVKGRLPVLCVTDVQPSGFAALLTQGGLAVRVKKPAQCQWSLEELSQFSAIILENIPAQQIGSGMENISAWVTETGTGLMLTGGKNSYGPGGYFRSVLEPIMPVSMELRREHRKLALAIVVVLDRSGSMAATVGGGRSKMDLANLASVEVLDLLTNIDEFGVIAVDSTPHTIVPLDSVSKNRSYRARILHIDSLGGGIFVYQGLFAAAQMLLQAKSGTKHIILFADAADAEQPGKYRELLAQCRKSNITVSVIGLGLPTDSDAGLLRDVAKRGGGRCFFTNKPEELPRLFAQDTFVVARSTFIDEATPVRETGAMFALTGRPFSIKTAIGGYNLCYLRPGTYLAAVTVDEYKAPVVASWQSGTGRVLCYTGEVDGAYTGAIASWPQFGNLVTSMVRWTKGDKGSLPANMLLTQSVDKGLCTIELHLDPEREREPFAKLPLVTTLRGIPGAKPQVVKNRLRWRSADILTIEIPMYGKETVLSSVDIPGVGQIGLTPVCLPYSPEFAPAATTSPVSTLEQIARASGGQERVNLTNMWQDMPKQVRIWEIGHWLLLVAIVFFLIEILQRRTGIFSTRQRPALAIEAKESRSKTPIRKFYAGKGLDIAIDPAQPAPAADVSSEADSLVDALQQAKKQSTQRRG